MINEKQPSISVSAGCSKDFAAIRIIYINFAANLLHMVKNIKKCG